MIFKDHPRLKDHFFGPDYAWSLSWGSPTDDTATLLLNIYQFLEQILFIDKGQGSHKYVKVLIQVINLSNNID